MELETPHIYGRFVRSSGKKVMNLLPDVQSEYRISIWNAVIKFVFYGLCLYSMVKILLWINIYYS